MIRLIAAIDRKRGIAKHGYRPWYIPDDHAYFINKSKSSGGNILVGGTTFRDAFKGKPPPERTTYLLTRNEDPIDGVTLVHDLQAWLESLDNKDIWVAGGAAVYQQVIDSGLADELYLTHIDADFGCDQFFPEYESKFSLSSQNQAQEQNGFHFSYACYTRSL
jgi:dihydrofolate reductase